MRWRVIALLSLGVNIALLAGVFLISRPGQRRSPNALVHQDHDTATTRTNVVLRRQLFSWREIESPDYPTYIANLRDLGCPEQTIRDIIIAEVNALFAKRRATELTTPEQQWWRTEPDTNVLALAAEKAQSLENDRRALLTRLLGPSWESGDMVSLPRPSRPAVALDGPLLGALPVETKQAIETISAQSQDKLQAYLDEQRRRGEEPDPLELARFRQQTRQALTGLLSPPQLEEFLLRYSQNANDLRARFRELQFFNPTQDEFRNIFRAIDPIDQQIELAVGTEANVVEARQALENQRENTIRNVLGPRRYEEFQMLQDPLYRSAVAAAQQAGTPEAARTIYQVNLAAAAEQDRIRSDATLTAEQKEIELKSLELSQLQANTVATGRELPPEPAAPQPQPPKRAYVTRQGDTAAVISMIYGVPVNALRAANPNVDFSRLRPGISLNIPRSQLPPLP